MKILKWMHFNYVLFISYKPIFKIFSIPFSKEIGSFCIIFFIFVISGFLPLISPSSNGGKYIIFDLPYFSALQEYYLKSVGIKTVTNFKDKCNGTLFLTDINDLCKQIKSVENLSPNSLFLANWSLSETPLEVREKIIPLIANFHNILIAYQSTFMELNNVEYFEQFKDKFKHMNWQNWIIPHLGTNRYLVGKKSNI